MGLSDVLKNEKIEDSKIQNRDCIEAIAKTEFEKIKKLNKVMDLVNFHSRNKYLFMTMSPLILKKLGRIVANKDDYSPRVLFDEYEESLLVMLSKNPTHENRVNTIEHIYGYFKYKLDQKEKNDILRKIKSFSDKEISYQEILSDLMKLAQRFSEKYLLEQNIFLKYDKK